MKTHCKVQQEIYWLVEHEVPNVVNDLICVISTCLKSSLGKTSNKFKLVCTSSTSGAEALRGSVLLHRDTLCALELFIKPSKTVGTIKSSFRNDKQWKLQQVQDAMNHMRKANELLNTYKQCKCSYSAEGIICVLDDVMKHLSRCQSRLAIPCQLSLHALIGHGFTKMFSPPLPGDTLMNVFVLEDRLVITHYNVQQAHTNASFNPTKSGKLNAMSVNERCLFHSAGSILEHSGNRYEVSSANRAECSIPLLTNVLRTVSSAQMICQNLKDKLVILSNSRGSTYSPEQRINMPIS